MTIWLEWDGRKDVAVRRAYDASGIGETIQDVPGRSSGRYLVGSSRITERQARSLRDVIVHLEYPGDWTPDEE